MSAGLPLAGRVALVIGASRGIGRVCRPQEVASVVRFLVSARTSYVSGQGIRVDGGG